jgi:hypothetical protein
MCDNRLVAGRAQAALKYVDVMRRLPRLLALILIFCAQPLFAQQLVHITFERGEVGKFPSGWQSMDVEKGANVYSVQGEGEKKFLHADAHGQAVQISYEKKWPLNEFPVLRWQWRAITFPAGSNERVKGGADSVLGVYVVLSGLPFVTTIKYIWSETLPEGTVFDSPYSSGTKIMVVRSGRALAGTWVTEERNVLSDYEHLFGKKEKHPVARGIAVLTDSDDTRSRAAGDYGDIAILSGGGNR